MFIIQAVSFYKQIYCGDDSMLLRSCTFMIVLRVCYLAHNTISKYMGNVFKMCQGGGYK